MGALRELLRDLSCLTCARGYQSKFQPFLLPCVRSTAHCSLGTSAPSQLPDSGTVLRSEVDMYLGLTEHMPHELASEIINQHLGDQPVETNIRQICMVSVHSRRRCVPGSSVTITKMCGESISSPSR